MLLRQILQIVRSFLCGQFIDDDFGETRIGLQSLAHVFERRVVGMTDRWI